MNTWKIVFAGTPEFAVPSLRVVLSKGAKVPLVLTQPDRPVGRGRKLSPSPVKAEASSHGLNLLQPSKLRKALIRQQKLDRPDLMIVVAYGMLLPEWFFNWPRLGTINVHASLLPRWRGASPIQHAILAGDKQTGVSIMQIDNGLDTGSVYGERSLSIGKNDNSGTLHQRLSGLGAELLDELLPDIINGSIKPIPQDSSQATLAPKIHKSDAVLDWTKSAENLVCQVRAFNPWPVSESTTEDGKRLRIYDAAAINKESEALPGSIVVTSKQGIDVATGDGILRITHLQPPGGKVMSASEYLNANSLKGSRFGLIWK